MKDFMNKLLAFFSLSLSESVRGALAVGAPVAYGMYTEADAIMFGVMGLVGFLAARLNVGYKA